MERVLAEYIESLERFIEDQNAAFERYSGGRSVIASLLQAGAIHPDFDGCLRLWHMRGGTGDLVINGVSVLPPVPNGPRS